MIIRGERPADNFAQIHNAALADGRLSFKARGILAYLLSRPPGWKTSAERLAKSGVDGERAIKSGLKELEAAGYLKRSRSRKPDGTWDWSQIITDQPASISEDTTVDFTTGAFCTDGDPASADTVDTIGTLCTGGKQPDINNTEPNNTYSSAADDVVSPSVRATTASTTEQGREAGVAAPTPSRSRGWMPSDAALKTAHDSIELQDITLSITHYRIRCGERGTTPSSSEWLRWLVEDEKKLQAEDRKQAKENGTKKPWYAVAGD